MNQERLDFLLSQYKQDQCTTAELEELNEWFHAHNPGRQNMEDWLREAGGNEALTATLLQDLKSRVNAPVRSINYRRIARIAAVLLVAASGIVLFYTRTQSNQHPIVAQTPTYQIKPGGDKATLTLADGSKIVLDSAGNGQLAVQDNTQINKVTNGSISYEAADNQTANNKVVYNTLTTPRGGKFALTLADGTSVTLDAESSITYPVTFTGKERRVTITGQAYFEVVHNAAQPFRVVTKGQVIEDIGTAFNVNAYQDDPSVKVTLAEGLINVSNSLKTVSLVPGQQAEINDGQQNIRVNEANVSEVVAWKNGWFAFHNEPVKSVMKQAARWYDVDIEYEGADISKRFGGNISKYKDISELLENLRITGGINYRIEGRRIILINR